MRLYGIIPEQRNEFDYEIKKDSLIVGGNFLVFDSLTTEVPNSCLGAQMVVCIGANATQLLGGNTELNGAEYANINAENPLTLGKSGHFMPSRFQKLQFASQLDETLISVVRFPDNRILVYMRQENSVEAAEMINGLINVIQTQIYRAITGHPAPPFHHSPLCLLLTPSLLKPAEDSSIIFTLPNSIEGENTDILFRLIQNIGALNSLYKSMPKQASTASTGVLQQRQHHRISKEQQDPQHILKLQNMLISQEKQTFTDLIKALEQSREVTERANQAVEMELVHEARGVNERKLVGLKRTIDDVDQQISFRRTENTQKSELINMTQKPHYEHHEYQHQEFDEPNETNKRNFKESFEMDNPFIEKENDPKRRTTETSFNIELSRYANYGDTSRPNSRDRTRPISASSFRSFSRPSSRPVSRIIGKVVSEPSLAPHEE